MYSEVSSVSPALVSVITATYGHEDYIAECIRSVQGQSYSHWEMIVVDDGSPDRTFEIALKMANEDPRIRVFQRENVGIFRLGETYNFALERAEGKYVAVLEGDDVWEPEKLALQVEALENDAGAVLSWGKAWVCDRDLENKSRLLPEFTGNVAKYNNQPPGSLIPDFFYSLFIPALTLVFRKEALLASGGFIQKYHLPLVDVTTCLALVLKGRFVFLNAPLGCWRTYPSQVTKTHMVEMTRGFYTMALDFFEENRDHPLVKTEDKRRLDAFYKSRMVVAYSRSGRFKLIRKDFKGARKDYLNSILYRGGNEFLWRVRSLTGLLFSFFHLNVEGLARWMGRTSYR